MFKVAGLLSFLFLGLFLEGAAQAPVTVSIKEMKAFKGHWEGKLTYLDYTSGTPYSMPANLTVTQAGKRTDFQCAYSYPNEASANSIDTMVLSADGHRINGRPIISKQKLPGGRLEIITELESRDGNENKAAFIRTTYTIGKNAYTNKKEVRFKDGSEWIQRHEYSYTRKR